MQISSREALDAALAAGVEGVAVDLPPEAEPAWWAEMAAWQAAARDRRIGFQLQWDRLIREEEFPRAQEVLAQVAALQPDALILRDPGLCRLARSRHPELALQAAAACGLHNSPGLRWAEGQGYRRVALAGPLHLKDLALMRRQVKLPLEVVLPQPCPGHLCLLADYPEFSWPSGGPRPDAAGVLLDVLELLPGLAQFGVAAVRLGWVFSQARPLSRIIELCQLLRDAAPAERPRLLEAAREVITAFGEEFQLEFPSRPARGAAGPASVAGAPPVAPPRSAPEAGRVWLEARDYREAAFLVRERQEPLILQLNQENYTAFLSQYRRWQPRRLIWRLPPLIPEAALPFWQQAILTLMQGGFSRFLAGDWGAVQLVREADGQVFGDQSLGVRNSLALAAAQDLGVSKVCLPPGRGPEDWQELVQGAARGSFWGYLYHLPALMVCPRGEEGLAVPDGTGLRWLTEGDLVVLLPEAAEDLGASRAWFEQRWVAPLVISLARTHLPLGQLPDLARPPRPARQGPGVRGQGAGKRQGPRGREQGPEKKGAGAREQRSGRQGQSPPQSRRRPAAPTGSKPRGRRRT